MRAHIQLSPLAILLGSLRREWSGGGFSPADVEDEVERVTALVEAGKMNPSLEILTIEAGPRTPDGAPHLAPSKSRAPR